LAEKYIDQVKARIFAERKRLMAREEEMRKDADYYSKLKKGMADANDMRWQLCDTMLDLANKELTHIEAEKAELSVRLRNLGAEAYELGIANVELTPLGPNDDEFWQGIDSYLQEKLRQREQGRSA